MSKVNFKKMFLISEERFKNMNVIPLAKENINYDNNTPNQKKRNFEGKILSNNRNSAHEEGPSERSQENSIHGTSFKAKPKIPFRKVYTRKYKINKTTINNERLHHSKNRNESNHQTDINEEKGYQPLEKKQKKSNQSNIPCPPKTKTKWLKL